MLIEVKTKVAWVINGKTKKKIETYILDKEVFAQAEYEAMTTLNVYKGYGQLEDYEVQSLKLSTIKEIITQYEGQYSFIVTLKDIIHQDDGSEKQIKYKILLWANSISEAMSNAREIASQGYDMQIDGLKEVNYTYLNSFDNEESTEDNNTRGTGCTSQGEEREV